MIKNPYFVMFLVPIFWGLAFPITHNAVMEIDASIYAFLRSASVLIFIAPFAYISLRSANTSLIFYSLIFGFLLALQFLGHSNSLKYLSSSTTAFIISTNAIILIIITSIIQKKLPEKIDLLAISLGVLGASLILNPTIHEFNLGYLWSFLSASSIALSILLIGYVFPSKNYNKTHGSNINFIFFQALFSSIFLLYYPWSSGMPDNISLEVLFSIIYMAIFATIFTFLIQTKYQSKIGSIKSALIYNLDVFFACIFGALNHENFTLMQLLGGLFIFIASIMHPLYILLMKNRQLT